MLFLESNKWKLENGKAYTVRLVAGSRSVEAKALAESKAVTIALTDRTLNDRLRTADVLEVRGEGASLRVPPRRQHCGSRATQSMLSKEQSGRR